MKTISVCIILFLSLLLISCSQSISNPQNIVPLTGEINAIEIKIFMSKLGLMPDSYIVVDKNYETTTEKYITEDFSTLYNKFLFDFRNSLYSASNQNCNKFSLSCEFFGHQLYSNSKHKADYALAVGEIGYVRWDGVAHEINFFLIKDGGGISIIFFEPQTQKEVVLTDTELRSCFFYRI